MTTKGILLDTNIIIAVFDKKDPEAQKKFEALSNDDNVAFAINPLIRYEVLRGVAFDKVAEYEELQDILSSFEEFDIGRDESELASNIFRYAKKINRNIVNKRSFDVLHYTTAHCNDLELHSNDGDITKIAELHDELNSSEDHSK